MHLSYFRTSLKRKVSPPFLFSHLSFTPPSPSFFLPLLDLETNPPGSLVSLAIFPPKFFLVAPSDTSPRGGSEGNFSCCVLCSSSGGLRPSAFWLLRFGLSRAVRENLWSFLIRGPLAPVLLLPIPLLLGGNFSSLKSSYPLGYFFRFSAPSSRALRGEMYSHKGHRRSPQNWGGPPFFSNPPCWEPRLMTPTLSARRFSPILKTVESAHFVRKFSPPPHLRFSSSNFLHLPPLSS